jgi:hypothetical protein
MMCCEIPMVNLKTMKKSLYLLMMGFFLITSCDPTEPVDPQPTQNRIVNTSIKTNTTWYSDTVYQLGGRIAVENGATLTIQAGTVIKGEAGTGANATALLIARGGKLIAEGTVSKPIIFTSIADEITPELIEQGVFTSPNLDPTVNGLWGGVIILGEAKISASNTTGDVSSVQIEGIPTSDQNGLYGGTNDLDNSGVIRYVSIRHGGANIGSGNEINGLTLGGVGSGTIVENVEVVGNQDDAIECFGGKVNLTNVVSWNAGDDGFDTDQSWGGTLDNFVIISPANHMFELDGPEGSFEQGHTIKNGDVYVGSGSDLINVDNNSIVDLQSIFFTNVSSENQKINRVTAPLVTFSDIVIDVTDVSLYVNGTVPTGVSTGTTSKANKSVFTWTWASQSGNL